MAGGGDDYAMLAKAKKLDSAAEGQLLT